MSGDRLAAAALTNPALGFPTVQGLIDAVNCTDHASVQHEVGSQALNIEQWFLAIGSISHVSPPLPLGVRGGCIP